MADLKQIRSELHTPTTFGQRAADLVAKYLGSWRFVLIQNGLIFLWIILNLIGWWLHWDPWPFLFLNIVMSWQAANSSPILQMSANRQATRDRKRDDLEAQEVHEILTLLREIREHQKAAAPWTTPRPYPPYPYSNPNIIYQDGSNG